MYRYDQYDQRIVNERVAQFRDQMRRRLAGELTEDEFRPLRLQNGLYIQRHAPMLRIAVPYGLLSTQQMRMLAHIARKYDRGYGHFTTRQNIQFNWLKLEDVPDILAELATVEMHAIQTCGNCIRNITTDQFAGVAADEIVDPRPYAEIVRQWSTFHPEFAYLPRKFKIAVNGVVRRPRRHAGARHRPARGEERAGEVGFRVLVGGGLGRTPIIGSVIREFLPWQHLLTYLEAILRVYNRYGRRDNIYKARIKILVKALGLEEFARQVEAELERPERRPGNADRTRKLSAWRPSSRRRPTRSCPATTLGSARRSPTTGLRQLGQAQRQAAQGAGLRRRDAVAEEDRRAAGRRDRRADGLRRRPGRRLQLRRTARHARAEPGAGRREAKRLLFALWSELKATGLATPNIGLLTDIICCPGGDFCSLANAKSIPIAEAIQSASTTSTSCTTSATSN